MTIRSSIEQATKSVMGAINPAEETTDLLDTLEAEHDEVKQLLKELTDSESAAEQRALVAKIKQALIPHTKAEERVLYDRLDALSDNEAKTMGAEGYTEHALASATLAQLDKQTANTPEFKASAKVLKELVTHHIKEEEGEMFSKARDKFSGDQREQMNREFLAAKKTVPVS